MTRFSSYQYVYGDKSDKDELKLKSKFWNEGKWNNFILPFLPKDCGEMIFVDMGCNAGLFLEYAEKLGFRIIYGIESNADVFQKALEYKKINGGRYVLVRNYMQRSLDKLPLADYVLFANSHYYFSIEQWVDFMDKLAARTCYCIIVTAHDKRGSLSRPSPLVDDIVNYFNGWEKVGYIGDVSQDDPLPRDMKSLCFKSRLIKRIDINDLRCFLPDSVYDFLRDYDNGIPYTDTEYYKYRVKKARNKISKKKINWGIMTKIKLYRNLRKSCMFNPIIVNKDNIILEGNHRYASMKYLGFKTIIVRVVE